MTFSSPDELDFSGKTLKDVIAWRLVWLMATGPGTRRVFPGDMTWASDRSWSGRPERLAIDASASALAHLLRRLGVDYPFLCSGTRWPLSRSLSARS